MTNPDVDTEHWDTSVSFLVQTFRDALDNLRPFAERVKIPTVLPGSGLTDSWEHISGELYYYFVIEALRHGLPEFGGKDFRWAEYETHYESLKGMSFVSLVPTRDESVLFQFTGFTTSKDFLDTVAGRPVDGKGRPAGEVDRAFPIADVAYRFVHRLGTPEMSVLDTICVRL